MLLHIPKLLDAIQLETLTSALTDAATPWIDGRATTGLQSAAVKNNRQLAEQSPLAQQLGAVVLAALERNSTFIAASLPHRVVPPLFNRYEAGMAFGEHIDNAVRVLPGSTVKLRTDLSATLFLSNPADYDGGELVIQTPSGIQRVRLPAGDLLLYAASTVHQVTAVTRGVRLASVFWVQSMVRDEAQRSLLFDMDRALQRLAATGGDAAARLELSSCYHNLLRQWAEV